MRDPRYVELYLEELERLLKAEFLQPGTEGQVANLHGKAGKRIYFVVDPSFGNAVYIRAIPKVSPKLPAGQKDVVWANIFWRQKPQRWVVSVYNTTQGYEAQTLHRSLDAALRYVVKVVGGQAPKPRRGDLRRALAALPVLYSVVPTMEQIEKAAKRSAEYWLSVETEREFEEHEDYYDYD